MKRGEQIEPAVGAGAAMHHLHAVRFEFRLRGRRGFRSADNQQRNFARRGDKARARRDAQRRVEDDAQGPAVLEAGQPHGHQGIVGEHGARADHDRVVHGAHHMHAIVRGGAGDGEARVVLAAGGIAVRRFGEFQRHHRAFLRHAQDVAEIGAAGLVRAHAFAHLDAGGAQHLVAAARHAQVGILQGGDDARDRPTR